MRWVAFQHNGGGERIGIVVDGRIHAAETGLNLTEAMSREPDGLTALGLALQQMPNAVFDYEAVRIGPPIRRPPSFRDFMAFEAHVRNSFGRDPNPAWYEAPGFYFSNPAAMVGTDATVVIAPGCEKWDFELEIGVVVGRAGQDLTPAEAERCIAGYTILCDYSARDLQIRESAIGLGPVKGKDTATGFGPCLVTPDELTEFFRDGRLHLEAQAEINGAVVTRARSGDMHWSFGQMLAYASRGTSLFPGDVIGSGTLGRGCIFELRALNGKDSADWLRPGDRLTLTIEQLGSLSATMAAGKAPVPLS